MDGKLGYLYSIWIFNALASSRPTVIKIHCCFIIVHNSQNSTLECFHNCCVLACLPSDSPGFGFILCQCLQVDIIYCMQKYNLTLRKLFLNWYNQKCYQCGSFMYQITSTIHSGCVRSNFYGQLKTIVYGQTCLPPPITLVLGHILSQKH